MEPVFKTTGKARPNSFRSFKSCVNAAIPKATSSWKLPLKGKADVIIRGDEDLLTMNPGRGIAIVPRKIKNRERAGRPRCTQDSRRVHLECYRDFSPSGEV
jgi:hypothetical protein